VQLHSSLPLLSSKNQDLVSERQQFRFQVGAAAKDVPHPGE
jgi:hypothetical protein